MYDLITSVVLYDSNYSDIGKYITQYFEENMNQKLVFVDNSEEDKIRGYINDIVGINKYDIDYMFSGDNLGYGKGNNLAINKYVGFVILSKVIFLFAKIKSSFINSINTG